MARSAPLCLVEHPGQETSCLALAATAVAALAKPSLVDRAEKGWLALRVRTKASRLSG